MVLNDLVDSFCYSQKNAGLKGQNLGISYGEMDRRTDRQTDLVDAQRRPRAAARLCVVISRVNGVTCRELSAHRVSARRISCAVITSVVRDWSPERLRASAAGRPTDAGQTETSSS